MKLKHIILAAMLPLLSLAADYQLLSNHIVVAPGGLTNTVAWMLPHAGSAEVVELHVYGGTQTDTATVSRVSCGGYVTNVVAVIEYSDAASASCTVTNYGIMSFNTVLTWDRLVCTGTGTNSFKFRPVYRLHGGL